MRVIFRGEEKRQKAKMEKEASRIHSHALSRLDEAEEMEGVINADEKLLEEILRKEEEEVMALLVAVNGTDPAGEEMQDIDMSDIEV